MKILIPNKSAFGVQCDVIWALYLRETKTRFGLYKLGLVWAIIEPLATTIILGVMLGFFLQRATPDIPYPLFILCGFIPFRLFTGIVTSSVNALRSNQGLLVYRQVTPIDPFIARVMIEVVFSVASFILFIVVWSFFQEPPSLPSPLAMTMAMFNLLLLSLGVGVLVGVHARYHPELVRVVPLMVRPLLYVSCVLYPLSIIPEQYQHFILWNPLAVTIETFRASLFEGYTKVSLSMVYPFCCGVILLASGLAYYRRERAILHEEPRK